MLSMKQERKINYKEMRELKPSEKLAFLKGFATKTKALSEWRSAIAYVLKSEQEPLQQYELLEQLFLLMHEINAATLASVLNDINEEYKCCRSLGSFYLAMRYLTQGKSYIRNITSLNNIYSLLVEKYEIYEQKILQLEGSPVEEYPQQLVKEVSVAIEVLPRLFKAFANSLDTRCMPVLLSWMVVYPQRTRHEVQCLSDFSKYILQDICKLGPYKDFNQQKIIDFVVAVINRCSLEYPQNDNLLHVIEAIPDSNIRDLDESDDIVNIGVDRIVHAFECLSKSGVTPKFLKLVYAVSFGLRKDEDYFTLTRIYKDFVLPRLIRNCKAIPGQGQTLLRNIVTFYVQGFFGWPVVNAQQLAYFVQYYQLLQRKSLKYWLEMALLTCAGKDQMIERLKQITTGVVRENVDEILSDTAYHKAMEGTFDLVEDDFQHQRKKYVLKQSRMSGIRNTSSVCYIISSIQALFMAKGFPELLRSYAKEYVEASQWGYSGKVKIRLLYELNYLMGELKDCRPIVKVDLLKMYGPAEFKSIQGQQDCHEYLIQLLDYVEKDMGRLSAKSKEAAVTQFKNLFELTVQSTLACEKCKSKQINTIHPNIHSIGCQQTLSLNWVDHVDHTCDSCGSKNPNRQQSFRLAKLPEIFLVHIKRFQYREGKAVKKLDKSDILRTFHGYKLMGFISHIGRTSLSGHYVLYCRKETNMQVWYQFNDQKVFEFKTQSGDEPFERNFKLSNTPYILIYRRL